MTREAFIHILKMAVENEKEAYEFYSNASEITKDTVLQEIFSSLAKDELKHKALLEGCMNGTAELSFEEAPDYRVSETVEAPALSIRMKFADAIALAMKKEEEAMNLYKFFAEASTDPMQRQMFLELSKMESGHKAGLEDVFLNAACAEAW